jgi:hypothetical protein
MAISVPKSPSASSRQQKLIVRPIPAFPKANASRGLVKKLEAVGVDPEAAASLSRAVVDPTDVRRRLEWPAPIRVPGATLWTIEVDVWTPAVAPFIGNYREAASRVFPTDGAAIGESSRLPIRLPTSDPGGQPILDLKLEDADHLIQAVDGSISYLVEHNHLSDSIAEKGVMVPITVALSRIAVNSVDHPILLPSTIDGSSRTAGALDVLGLSGVDLIRTYREDSRALAGFVGRIRALSMRPRGEVSPEELVQVNALILPARVIVGFEPAADSNDFAKAVHTYVQLIHGDLPPAAWSDTARIDSKADSVVSELERKNLITPNRALYLEGMLTQAEARRQKLPETADERGLYIADVISDPKDRVHAAIRAGVVQPSEKRMVTKSVKAEIAAELALRGARSTVKPKEAKHVREVLANVYSSPTIWEQGVTPSGRSPEELLDGALREHREGELGPTTAELAALSGFWLAVRRVLRDPRFFKEENFRDSRKPSMVINAMTGSEWGLKVLAKALADGREGGKIEKIDEEGQSVVDEVGGSIEADHVWLRGTVVPPPPPAAEEGSGDADAEEGQAAAPPLPERVLSTRRKALEKAVEVLEQRCRELELVTGGDGDALVDSQGLPTTFTEPLRERIDAISRAVTIYGSTWEKTADVSSNSENAR